jgi:RNA recognition motif-containing protein
MGNRLYVGNLSFNTSSQALRDHFSAIGDVTDVHVVTDRDSGQSRGFAFVSFGSAADAERAVSELNGVVLDGRELKLDEAQERPARAGGDAGGRRGRAGRDRF